MRHTAVYTGACGAGVGVRLRASCAAVACRVAARSLGLASRRNSRRCGSDGTRRRGIGAGDARKGQTAQGRTQSCAVRWPCAVWSVVSALDFRFIWYLVYRIRTDGGGGAA